MLPKIPKAFNKRAMQTIRFGGINLTESAGDGELRDSRNMTSAFYPTLTQRKARVAVEGYTAPTDLFEWDGKLIVVDGNFLYIDGNPVVSVLPGKKQFAVVNTKLVIYPDQILVDLSSGEFVITDNVLWLSECSATHKSITATAIGYNKSVEYNVKWNMGEKVSPLLFTYVEADIASYWVDGKWETPGTFNVATPFPVAFSLQVGNIFIPMANDRPAFAEENLEPLDKYNKYGRYAKVTGITYNRGYVMQDCYFFDGTGAIPLTPAFDGLIYLMGFRIIDGEVSDQYAHAKLVMNGGTVTKIGYIPLYNDQGQANIINAGSYGQMYLDPDQIGTNIAYDVTEIVDENDPPALSDYLAEDDVVIVNGPDYGFFDAHTTVVSVTDNTNTVTFPDNTFTVPDAVCDIEISTPGTYYTYYDSTYYSFVYEGEDLVRFFLKDGTVYTWADGKVTALTTTEAQQGLPLTFNEYDLSSMEVKITKLVNPEFDYICSSNNRLVGVKNDTQSIYVSALGDPTDFDPNGPAGGTESGPFIVPVGSEGHFTGVIDYGGNILAWKEFRLHKILGATPSTYYMHDSTIMGVQEGSSRSMKIVNNVLYYKGPYGVYAYGGNTPTLISYNLGNDMYYDAVADSDGRGYYIAMTQGGVSKLYVYDLTHGTWMIEDEIPVDAMATVNGTLHFLSNGSIYKTWQDADETISWMVEFGPTVEAIRTSRTTSTLMFQKKGYTKVILALDMAEGSHVTVSTKQDNDIWRTAWNKDADRFLTYTVPLMLGRCQRFALKIEGQGKVMIRGIQREAVIGSEVPL